MNMLPSSTSSSSSSQERSGGLMRYGSAPGSLLTAAVDSVIGVAARNEYTTQLAPSRFFPSCSDTNNNNNMNSDQSTAAAAMPNLNDNVSTLTTNPNPNPSREQFSKANSAANAIGSSQHRSNYGFPSGGGGGGGASLVRHSSSPAGFLNQLATAASDINNNNNNNNGFCITSGIGTYNSKGIGDNGRGISRLNSQLSFTRKEGLSRISEETENGGDGFITDNNGQRKSSSHSYGFGMGSWDETNNPIIFSVAPSKRPKTNMNSDVDHTMESQFEFSMAQTLEMDAMDKLLHIPQDSVPCKIRAKRGCATHPRSIAERERRTRISGKLKKLQDLVPNMDKQTSYADMLDLAVQHIKTLQNQVQKLNKEVDNCTCGCSKNTTDS